MANSRIHTPGSPINGGGGGRGGEEGGVISRWVETWIKSNKRGQGEGWKSR